MLTLVNAVHKNQPRTKAFDEYNQPVKYIGAREIEQMNKMYIHIQITISPQDLQ